MSTIHYFECNKYTVNLVDPSLDQYFSITGFNAKDGSAYLTLNSGEKINYAKFSYHPLERRFHYAFTNELWELLDKAGKGKKNSERIKSKVIDLKDNQILCTILVDKSSLYRKGIPESNALKINFPDRKIFQVVFSLENKLPIVNHRFIDSWDSLLSEIEMERNNIYEHSSTIKSSRMTGVAHLMNDFEFPWKMLSIGI